MSLVIEQTEKGPRYCRRYCKEREALQDKLLEYYGFKNNKTMGAVVFSSGMNAIGAVMNVLGGPGKSIFILGNELYCDTPKACAYQKWYNKEFSYETTDIRDETRIMKLFETHTTNIKLFFIESCSNPSGQVFNFELIPKLRSYAPNCMFCVDNTWLTAYSFNPFHYGIDIVIESMTKYISGGKCIGGMMVAKENFATIIVEWMRIYGQFVGFDHCKIYSDGLATLESRVRKVSDLTMQTATFLESCDKNKVTRVMYPFLQSHPTYNLAKKYIKFSPGIVLFHLNRTFKSMDATRTYLSKNKYLEFATSYGSALSRIDQFPKMGNSFDFDRTKSKDLSKGIWIRIAIGYDSNIETIINGLNQIIS